jgi:AcrR family transcriptional regulator
MVHRKGPDLGSTGWRPRYSHFTDKRAIVAAVALEGFAELANVLRVARKDGAEPAEALRVVADAYLQF